MNPAAPVQRLAIIARRAPLPISTGINLVVSNVSTRLARQFEVRMFVTDGDAPPADANFPVPVAAFGKSAYGDDGGAGAQGEFRSTSSKFYGVPMERERWLEREIDQFKPDAVLAFGYDLAPYLHAIVARYPVVFDVIDSEILHLWRQMRRGDVRATTLKHLLMSTWVAFSQLSKCDALVTVSEEDSVNVRRLARHDVVRTIANGVDCDFFAADSRWPTQPGVIVFSGSLSWVPNAQALTWFLENCWRQVLEQKPQTRLVVVGKGIQETHLRQFAAYPGISAHANVADIRDFIGPAQISIAPMISGSGIKNKILEAWALERAVVATPLAAIGLRAQDRGNILIAGSPAEFTRSVVELLQDPVLSERLGRAGRRTAVENYSWDSVVREFADLLASVARGRRQRR